MSPKNGCCMAPCAFRYGPNTGVIGVDVHVNLSAEYSRLTDATPLSSKTWLQTCTWSLEVGAKGLDHGVLEVGGAVSVAVMRVLLDRETNPVLVGTSDPVDVL